MKKKIIYFTLSILIILVGYVLVFPENYIGCSFLKLCTQNYVGFSIGQSLFFGFIPILIWFFVCLFLDFKKIKFSYNVFNYWLPISAILVFLTPTECRATLDICLDKEKLSLLLGILFLIFSIIYFIILLIQNRKK